MLNWSWTFYESIILASKAKESCIVNCGSGTATSFNKIVEQLNFVLGMNRSPEYIENPFQGSYQNHTACDMSLAKEKIDFVPEYSFEKGLMDYYNSGFLI
nr:hypothetical protein [uncultured Desulfobacter sp.]